MNIGSAPAWVLPQSEDDVTFPDEPPPLGAGEGVDDLGPQWLRVLLWRSCRPAAEFWVTCQSEVQPEGALWVEAAREPGPREPRMIVRSDDAEISFRQRGYGSAPMLSVLGRDGDIPDRTRDVRKHNPNAHQGVPQGRNLVTVKEFASMMNMASSSVFNLLKLGLPSKKTPGLGRRILRDEAQAWLMAGGATAGSRKARRRATSRPKAGRNG